MKVKFKDIDAIEQFIGLASQLQSDVIVGSGNRVVDGKSSLGMMQLNLNEEYVVSFVDRDPTETDAFIEVLKDRGIAHE